MSILRQLRDAAGKLNPNEVRAAAERPLLIKLRAGSELGYDAMFRFLLPEGLSAERRRRVSNTFYLEGEPNPPDRVDLSIVFHGNPAAPNEFIFTPGKENTLVRDILDQRGDLNLALARRFPIFRDEVSRRAIQTVSSENAMFSVATALPNIAPLVGFIWSPGEFASDTAFLTLNQIRLIFQLGAASDRIVGYMEQKPEIASVVTGAFGWRAVARELAGKIPMGGGLIPKAAIAFAGTWVVGSSIERLYRIGYGYTRAERSAAYNEAFERGKEVASTFLNRIRKRDN